MVDDQKLIYEVLPKEVLRMSLLVDASLDFLDKLVVAIGVCPYIALGNSRSCVM
jgi:hypothetical protein